MLFRSAVESAEFNRVLERLSCLLPQNGWRYRAGRHVEFHVLVEILRYEVEVLEGSAVMIDGEQLKMTRDGADAEVEERQLYVRQIDAPGNQNLCGHLTAAEHVCFLRGVQQVPVHIRRVQKLDSSSALSIV